VTAESDRKIINQILRTTSENYINVSILQKISSSNGMLGYNVNVANAIAAICGYWAGWAVIHESVVFCI
jgi:hydroxymethylglutaryl-CoA reductase